MLVYIALTFILVLVIETTILETSNNEPLPYTKRYIFIQFE